jgi:exonuclease III
MHEQKLHLVSWNVAHRKSWKQQAEALGRHAPDLVALQEIVTSTLEPWRQTLSDIGLRHSVDSLTALGSAMKGPRRYGEMIVSRWEVEAHSFGDFGEGWSERLLSVVADTPCGEVEIHTAYIPPGSSNGRVKIYTFEGIYKQLASPCVRPRVLCGDFNTPQEERGGEIITWGQVVRPDRSFAIRGKMRGTTGERWDRAERNILATLGREFDLVDVYRLLHGGESGDFSWYTRTGVGRRFDHIFASRSLNPKECRYLHDFRTSGLSDHSAIEAVFQPEVQPEGSR